MPNHNIIVVGASAGGVEALMEIVRGLPADLPAALFVVLHVPPHGTSMMPHILSRAGKLPAVHPRDGQRIERGHIYVAPPDQHLLVYPNRVRLVRGPRENGHRPAVDPLFRSAARAYGPRVVGVILSGTLDDGTAGLMAVKMRGGIAVAQDPDDALFSGMPRSAVENVAVDRVVPLAEMAPLLVWLAREPVAGEEGEGDAMYGNNWDKQNDAIDQEMKTTTIDPETLDSDQHPGTPSAFSCPECGGVLWELHDGDLVRYRCRVGHALSVDSLLAEQSEALEEALWAALRALEEKAALTHNLAARARERGQPGAAERFAEQERDATERAALVRKALLNGQPTTLGEVAAADEPAG